MLKKFGEEKLNFQLRQHFAAAVATFNEAVGASAGGDAQLELDRFFSVLGQRHMAEAENFRVHLLPRRWPESNLTGAALLMSLYEPELRFQKALFFRARMSVNRAPTEEANVFDTENIKVEAMEMLKISQSASFLTFAPQGIHVVPASGI